MDNSTVEHSDSDSGESWTLLDNSPTYGDEAPDSENAATEGAREEHVDLHSDKDEDTDGISIISDSEPESAPCELNYVTVPTEESPTEPRELALLTSPPTNNNHNNESIREETDFLGDNVRFKTYVHKRNHRVGSILDIIMLGTIVITAGMALGHLWSCKNECSTQTSVNEILSNLYKLQEENTFLRNKLKDITEDASYQLPQQSRTVNNKSNKQFRCKKIFEEPVMNNDKSQTAIKCVDESKVDVAPHSFLAIPEYEKEFLKDIDKLKRFYKEHKDWLDKELQKQLDEVEKSKNKQNMRLRSKKQLGSISIPLNLNTEADNKTHKQINLEKQLGSKYFQTGKNKHGTQKNTIDSSDAVITARDIILDLQSGCSRHNEDINANNPGNLQSEQLLEKKITYADSLKIDQPLQRSKRNKDNELPSRLGNDHKAKRKPKDEDVLLNLNTFSEDDIKKDDRYTGPKLKYEKKKNDRQKSHKRQKRNNKYEQWEMKGGYLKDFDEFSITSSQDNISLDKAEKKYLNADFENYVNKLIEAKYDREMPKITKNSDERTNKPEKRPSKSEKRKKGKTKDFDWYNQRSALRAEARLKLEQELFGENTSNNAAWYFRRMQKREQCRAQKDNSTFKKFYKHKMNFKMKR